MSDKVSLYVNTEITVSDDNSNSDTITHKQVGVALSGLTPDGRLEAVAEASGAWVGGNKAGRAYPTFSFSRLQASIDDDAWQIMNGIISGFTSTAATLGDYPYFDLVFSGTVGAETRSWALDDCAVTEYSCTDGDPSNVESFSIVVRGPVTYTGPNGTHTVISSR